MANNSYYEKGKKKYEYLKEQVLSSTNIVEVVERYGVALVRRGRFYEGSCPFHSEKTSGAFKVDPIKNKCKCFGCGDRWLNIFDFIGELFGLTFTETVDKLASDLGIIMLDDDTEETLTKRRKETKTIQRVEQRKATKHNKEKLSLIYKLFLETAPLTEDHLNYLKNQRGLTDQDIEIGGFKSFPTRQIMLKNPPEGTTSLIGLLEKNGLKTSDLIGSPIFYREIVDEKTNKTKITFKKNKNAIMIPICDAHKNIVGIQMRLSQGEVRYLWISSGSYADGVANPKLYDGTDSGAPLDVVYPSQIKRNVLFITEGKFKAITIAKQYGAVCVSVQGVGNWEGIVEYISEIEEVTGIEFSRICIAFDADLCIKPMVLRHLINMSNEISKHFDKQISCVTWDINVGKGIDDYLNAGGKTKDMLFKDISYIEKYIEVILNNRYILKKHNEGEKKCRDLTLTNVDSELFSLLFKELLWRN